MLSHEEFIDALRYFGGTISSKNQITDCELSLEEFLLESSLHMQKEYRVTKTILLWSKEYGSLLNLKKIKYLLDSGFTHEPATLGVLFRIAFEESSENLQAVLKKYTIKNKEDVDLFQGLPVIGKPDALFKIMGFRVSGLTLDEKEKYLIPKEKIFLSCKQLRDKIVKTQKTQSIVGLEYLKVKDLPVLDIQWKGFLSFNWQKIKMIGVKKILEQNIPFRGKEVNFIRTTLGLTLRELARKTGCTAPTILNWEKQKNVRLALPNEVTLRLFFAQLLGVVLSTKLEALYPENMNPPTIYIEIEDIVAF
jgi:DNA-binding transcriptional regulator YiaG